MPMTKMEEEEEQQEQEEEAFHIRAPSPIGLQLIGKSYASKPNVQPTAAWYTYGLTERGRFSKGFAPRLK